MFALYDKDKREMRMESKYYKVNKRVRMNLLIMLWI